jgi:ACS family glucarate transporter-like MFS transporter
LLHRLFTHRMMLGALIAQYAITALTWFFVGWFPLYLVHDFGATTAEAATLSAFPALAGFSGGLATGLFSDAVLRRTGNLTLARKLPVYIGITVAVAAMMGCLLVTDRHAVVALMALSFFGKQFGTLGWTLVADLAPRNRVEFTGSVVNAVGNLSGVFTPLLIGWLVAATGRFDAALVAVAAHGLVALASHAFITGRLERMPNL